jgi:hypothetical protein
LSPNCRCWSMMLGGGYAEELTTVTTLAVHMAGKLNVPSSQCLMTMRQRLPERYLKLCAMVLNNFCPKQSKFSHLAV